MELELMFAEQKWNILKCLSKGRYSPMQLAEMLNTTIANISQQLRLLEAANLVRKEKVKNREKGKPRSLFSLTDDCAYIIPAMHNFADKRLLRVSEHQRIILGIWFLDSPELHKHIEKVYWKIEPFLDKIEGIVASVPAKEMLIVADAAGEIEKAAGKSRFLDIKVISKDEAGKAHRQRRGIFAENFNILYDKNSMFANHINQKTRGAQ